MPIDGGHSIDEAEDPIIIHPMQSIADGAMKKCLVSFPNFLVHINKCRYPSYTSSRIFHFRHRAIAVD